MKNQTELFRRKVFPDRRRPEITRKKGQESSCPGDFRIRLPEGTAGFPYYGFICRRTRSAKERKSGSMREGSIFSGCHWTARIRSLSRLS